MFAVGISRFFWKKSIFIPLLALQLLQIVLVPPSDAPSNDDWMYANMVKTLLVEHRYEHHPFIQPTSVAHVVVGAAFVKVLGDSYISLKIATLALGIAGAWAVAQAAIVCGLGRRAALICGAIVLVNPLYVHLSNTFMSDVPYMAYTSFSALFYLKALRTGRATHVLCGGLWGAAAFFVRQFGLLPAAAYAVVVLYESIRTRRAPKMRAIVAYFIPWSITAIGYQIWRRSQTGVFEWGPSYGTGTAFDRFETFLSYGVVIATLIGLYLLPIAVGRAWLMARQEECWKPCQWGVFACCALAFIGTFVLYFHIGMPLPGNILSMLGVGPRTIGGDSVTTKESEQTLYNAWCIVTAVGVASASLMIAGAASRDAYKRRAMCIRPKYTAYLVVWAVLVFLSSYSPYTIYPYDRYTMPIIAPLSIIAMAWLCRRKVRCAAWMTFVPAMMIYAYSIAALQDYQAWTKSMWDALDYLQLEVHATPDQINGGYEFNGMYTSTDWVAKFHPKEFRSAENNGWWVFDDTYAVAFSKYHNYKTLKEFPYFSWLGMSWRTIYALERDDAASGIRRH